jgi:hypothetical protein
MSEYKSWLSSLGNSVVSPANPLKDTKTINSDGTVTDSCASSMSGYTIIEVDTIDKAVSISKECPFLKTGGTLEVSELIPMPNLS